MAHRFRRIEGDASECDGIGEEGASMIYIDRPTQVMRIWLYKDDLAWLRRNYPKVVVSTIVRDIVHAWIKEDSSLMNIENNRAG